MTSTQVKEDCPHVNTQTLLQVEKFKDLAFSELKCKNCSEKSEIFICLFCGEAFCSKKIKSHFIEHNISNPEHCLFLEIINYSIWCNECLNTEQNNEKGCYIHSEKTDEYINIYKDYINKKKEKNKKEEKEEKKLITLDDKYKREIHRNNKMRKKVVKRYILDLKKY